MKYRDESGDAFWSGIFILLVVFPLLGLFAFVAGAPEGTRLVLVTLITTLILMWLTSVLFE